MNPSPNDSEANLSQALILLLDRLGERPIYMDEVVNDDLTVAHIRRATWQELTDRELVAARPDIGCWRYRLTGSGWREALKLTGQLDTPEFQKRFGRLNAVLKTFVNGRKEDGFEQTHVVAAQARIPEEWLYNILESRIWEHEERRRGATLDDSKTMVVVPVDFNMPLSQIHGWGRDQRPLRVARTSQPRPQLWVQLLRLLRTSPQS